MSDYTEQLRKAWPQNFTEHAWDGEIFQIYSEDQIHLDLVGQSNVERINEDFEWVKIEEGRPYHRFVYVPVEAITEEIAEDLEELMRGLDMYPLYDDSDHSERENHALLNYVRDELGEELQQELGTDRAGAVEDWISQNTELIWEHNDGSVEDMPINVEELAKHVKL